MAQFKIGQGSITTNTNADYIILPQLTTAQIATITPVEGLEVYNIDTNKKQIYTGGSFKIVNTSTSGVSNNALYVMTSTVTTGNVTTETDFLTDLGGGYSLPANFASVGTTVRIVLDGLYGRGAGTSTFRVYLGSTLIGSSDSANAPNFALNGGGYSGYVDITFRSVGVSGTVVCGGMFHASTAQYLVRNGSVSGTPTATPTTINTTVSQQLRITHQFSGTNAANGFSILTGIVELLKN